MQRTRPRLPEPTLPVLTRIHETFRCIPRGVIQVGAHNGREVKSFAAAGLKHGVFIDPLDETFPTLRARTEKVGNYVALQAVVSAIDGEVVPFHVASNAGESSSILAPENHSVVKPRIGFSEPEHVTARSLDALIDEAALDRGDYDLLFIDAQGAEAGVIRGAPKTLAQVDFVWVEVSIGGIYAGDTPLPDFAVLMKTLGFELCFASLKRLGWGDALFAKRALFAGNR